MLVNKQTLMQRAIKISGRVKRIWILSISGFLLMSCNMQQNDMGAGQPGSEELNVSILEPVERDFPDIKQNGVLRIITNYSSNTYFLYRGLQMGFEYELVREFAKENDLALEVIIAGADESPYDLLNRGEGDLIAANYTITKERKKYVDFTRPYNLVDQIIVFNEKAQLDSAGLDELSGVSIAVIRNSSYYVRLKELQKQGYDFDIHIVSGDMDTEALLFQVANNRYDATVADHNMFEVARNYMRGLVEGPTIARNDTIAWAVRKNSEELKSRLNRFLYKHFRFGGEGNEVKRSALLNILNQRYFEKGIELAEYYNPENPEQRMGVISPYDNLMQEVADEFDLDWVMLTAIVAQESKFNPTSESWAGAVGLMQVLPRFSDISKDSLFIPEVNVREGARILKDHIKHYAYMDSTNQWAFALATYNAGLGHLADARRLVIDQNKNPNEWEPVSEALLMLMQRKYYQHARYGFTRGIETVRYVSEIMNRYKTYQAILALAESRNNDLPGVIGVKTIN